MLPVIANISGRQKQVLVQLGSVSTKLEHISLILLCFLRAHFMTKLTLNLFENYSLFIRNFIIYSSAKIIYSKTPLLSSLEILWSGSWDGGWNNGKQHRKNSPKGQAVHEVSFALRKKRKESFFNGFHI